MALVAWLHAVVFRLVAWALFRLGRLAAFLFLQVPVAATSRLLVTVWAWMNIMFRLWTSVAVGGIITLVVARSIVKLSPPGSNWRGVATLVVLIWLLVLFSAGRYTMEYLSLRRVRLSRQMQETSENARSAARSAKEAAVAAKDAAATKARGTPLEGMFQRNRDARSEREGREAAAVEQAEQERLDQEQRDAEIEQMNREHDPYGDAA